VAQADIKYLNITTEEVALAFSSRIRIQRYEARVTRHRPEHFMVLFDYPPQRDMAVQAGTVRVRGIDFDILPWTETQHSRDNTWWYRVRVAIENLSVHAWNAQIARGVLGDDCLFDKIEYATFRQEATDIFFCWAWTWNPDFLHRIKLMTIFPPGAGQSPGLGGLLQQNREVPPLPGDKSTSSSSTWTASRIGALPVIARRAPARADIRPWGRPRPRSAPGSSTSRTGCRGSLTATARDSAPSLATHHCSNISGAARTVMTTTTAAAPGGRLTGYWSAGARPSVFCGGLVGARALVGVGSATAPHRGTGAGTLVIRRRQVRAAVAGVQCGAPGVRPEPGTPRAGRTQTGSGAARSLQGGAAAMTRGGRLLR
jgi:hypothetical protein